MPLVDDNIVSVVESQKLYKVNIKNGNGMKIPNVPPYIEGEHIWSYISRLADMNGFDNTDRFLCELSSTSERKHWRNFQKFPYDASTPIIGNLLEIDGKEDWVVSATLADVLRISESLNAQGIRVRRYSEDVIRDGGFIFPGGNIVTKMKICPECRDEDVRNNVFHYHLVHQMPAMTVCPFHGCRLEEFCGEHGTEISSASRFEKLSSSKTAFQYAVNCNSILEAHAETSLQDLIYRIQTDFPTEFLVLKDVSPYLFTNWKKLNSCVFPDIVKTLNAVYVGLTDLLAKLKCAASHQNANFMKAIEGRFLPVSSITWGYVKLCCMTCGQEFHATPQSIIAGMGCPCCEEGQSRKERLKAMYSFHTNDEWQFNREMDKTTDMMKAIHLPTGNHVNAPVWSFLYEPLLPEPCIPLNLKDKTRMSQEERDKSRNERVAISLKMIEGFDLLAIDGYDVNTKLTLRHNKCGGTFEVFKTNFDASPFCRLCEGRYMYDEDDIKNRIKNESGDLFEWCGTISEGNNEWKATDGEHIILASCLAELLEKVSRISIYGWKKRDLSHLNRMIDDYIESHRGQIIFNEDLLQLTDDSRAVSNYLSRLKSSGILASADYRTYWHNGETHELNEVIEVKYGNRYGKRVGIPICDSLLAYAGILDKSEHYVYALQNTSSKAKSHEKRMVMNVPVDIFFFKGELSCSNWKLMAFIMTIKYKKFMRNWNEDIKKELVEWILESGFDEKDIITVEENFPNHIIRECRLLLLQETLHG